VAFGHTPAALKKGQNGDRRACCHREFVQAAEKQARGRGAWYSGAMPWSAADCGEYRRASEPPMSAFGTKRTFPRGQTCRTAATTMVRIGPMIFVRNAG